VVSDTTVRADPTDGSDLPLARGGNDRTVELVAEKLCDVGFVGDSVDHSSPPTGLFSADHHDVGVLGGAFVENGLLDQESGADRVPRVRESAELAFDRAFQIRLGHALARLIE